MARPRFKPSDDQKRSVESMAAYGIREDQIASTIGPKGIDAKTLRKHFRRELSMGVTTANLKVMQTLFQMATSGNSVAATIFWAKTRMGWKETSGPGLSIAPEREMEESHVDIHKRITNELARVQARLRVGIVSGQPEPQGETAAAIPMEELECAA